MKAIDTKRSITVDANEAVARVAHAVNEVIAIYPITPASPMGEFADAWSTAGRKNIFDTVPEVIEMQSEGGAAGAVHGALQAGALTTTFTASQGLLLMIPNMFKIAGELTPTVFHVASRSIATHALSIFCDHSDVMATRSTGWAMLASNSVQEAQDMAIISQAATLGSRVPFLHFFDGFRTSHEINKIHPLETEEIRAMIDLENVEEHRGRALDPDHPVLRGSAQNPDVFFQAREAANPFYLAVPSIVQKTMDRFAGLTGRQYRLFDYVGAPDAERVIIMMGSGAGSVEETIDALIERGEKIGLLKVRLFRPLSPSDLVAALPRTVRRIAALDRTKEPGALGEPLYQDVITALAEAWPCENGTLPPIVSGGRYGLSSKEFTPAMAKAIFDELKEAAPKRHFTIGIFDDVTHLSLKWNESFSTEAEDVTRAVFYGLGSDGTVSANKSTVKIIGENTPLHAQGYFVYDSRKSGAVTVSHLRFGPRPINSTYLISRANFIACHQFHFLKHIDVLHLAEPHATFLLNSPYNPDEVWDKLPHDIQQEIITKELHFFVVNANAVAADTGLEGRINTVMQTCFFALNDLIPQEEAIKHIKGMIRKSYGKRGQSVLERNFAAVDQALESLSQVTPPTEVTSTINRRLPVPAGSPDFVQRVTALIIDGKGDLLPVSALPVDGTFPTGTSRYEKRGIAREIPIWDPDICIECGLCTLVCPHSAIRMKAYEPKELEGAPEGFLSKPWKGSDLPNHVMTIQVSPDDCTGCSACVEICPVKNKAISGRKAINMEPQPEHADTERERFEFFLTLPEIDHTKIPASSIKGSQLREPLFEFPGACAGCGETPYLKLLTQLFGDRIIIANATGCSSIYGGNLPATPWSLNREGRGPAWANSLFEDNAEFGLGMRLAVEQREHRARGLLQKLAPQLSDSLVAALLENVVQDEASIATRREDVTALEKSLLDIDLPEAKQLLSAADSLSPRSVWIVGGDGWAYDIGFGGLDHVLASDRNVNILVLDTQVYSNTGGQASKATPRAAVAKFAAGGKAISRKDLGMIAVDYGNVYVAQVALGGNPLQTIKAFNEAQSWHGPSIIIAYCHCIAHGIDMASANHHQRDLVKSGFWPLYRYDPRMAHDNGHPFQLDSHKPSIPFREVAMAETRFSMLTRSQPEHAEHLLDLAQQEIDDRWHFYEQMAGVAREVVEDIEEEPTLS